MMARPTPRSAALNDVAAFVAVADMGSFTAAAERLGIAKARVSAAVRRLEESLGTALFHRTTRRVSLSERGRRLYANGAPLLQGLLDALEVTGDERHAIAGTLRISAPIAHAEQVLASMVAEFSREHPQLRIELRASDHIGDMIAEGIDVAIRMGWLRDSTQRAVKLGEFDQLIVAAPSYLRVHGEPRRPDDLPAHRWLELTLLPTPLTWRLQSRNGQVRRVRMSSHLRTDAPTVLHALARAGAGVTVLPRVGAEADLEEGRLQLLLPQWSLPPGGVYAVYPPGRHPPASARAFVEFYRARAGV